MKRTLVVLAVLILLGAFGITTQLPGTGGAAPTLVPASPDLPDETRALLGAWERSAGNPPPLRLIVRSVHPHSALVAIGWPRVSATGTFWQWAPLRARVLPGGRLHLSAPVRMTLSLSEDRLALVGVTTPSEPTRSVVLTRAATEAALAHALPLPAAH